MSRPLPHIPPQFAKLAALAERSTFGPERDMARRKAETLLPPEAGGFERALRILAYQEARARAPGNMFAGFDEFEEIDNPGHMARCRAAADEKLRRWHERRAALVKRYGSLDAVLEPCEREKALTKVLKPWRVPGKPPHQRWTWELKGWSSLTLASKMPADLKAAIETALPMPATFAEAQAELAYWRERNEDMEHALGENGRYDGDYGLDRVAVARMAFIRDLVEHGMHLTTLPEILERFRIFHDRENLKEEDIEAALLRDLEALAVRDGSGPSSAPAPTLPAEPSESGRIRAGLAAAAPSPGRSDRVKLKRQPSPWPTWTKLSHFGRLGMFDTIVAHGALPPAEVERMMAARQAYYRHQIPPSSKDQRVFNAACRGLWEMGWRPEVKAA